MPLLLHSTHGDAALLGATDAEYQNLYREAGKTATLPQSTPYLLRDGGASADAIKSANSL